MRISTDINVTAMAKGKDHYIFLYHDWQSDKVLRTIGRFASDPELNLSWCDAAVLSRKVREAVTQGESA